MKLPRQNDYPIYRCPSSSDCPRHVTISAVIAEDVVSQAARKELADAEGRASAAENAREVIAVRDRAQAELDSALRSFTAAGLESEPAAVERLAELRHARDDAEALLNRIGPRITERVNAAEDWDEHPLELKRDLIRETIESAIVAPTGRGAERIRISRVGKSDR